MPIPSTKQELLDAIETEHALLKQCLDGIAAGDRDLPGVCHEWSVKDIVAHLVEWKKMFLGWHAEGLRGGNPPTPSPDLKWNQTPLLNDRIYRKWKDTPAATVFAEFDSTYAEMLRLAKSLPEDKLFQLKLYPWMRAWPLARWIAANTSSHYRWARTRIRKWAKARSH